MRPKTIRTPAALAEAGLAPAGDIAALERVAARYAVAITPAVAELIDRTDPADPIARQFVPDAAELDERPDERSDPIGDDAHSPVAGIVHRYPDRVLLKLTHICATYCRFCFRRETVGQGGVAALSREALDSALRYIAQHREIWEVIFSGGDPFVLSARRLRAVVQAAGRHRARPDHPDAYPPAGGRAGADHARAGARRKGARQGDLRGAPCQPSARADARRARGVRADSSMPEFRC